MVNKEFSTLAIVKACAVVGLDGHIIEVQVDFNPHSGIPSFTIVGLPDTAVCESRERVRSAIKNSNYTTQKRLRGSSPQVGDGLVSTLEGRRQQEKEVRYSGLRFPNSTTFVFVSRPNYRE